jgi:hypothetical protein
MSAPSKIRHDDSEGGRLACGQWALPRNRVFSDPWQGAAGPTVSPGPMVPC